MQTRSEAPRASPLAVCYGTRPQVIKASVLISSLMHRWPLVTIDTGQHYDYELNRLLYEQLAVPEPTHYLEIGAASPAKQLSRIIDRAATVLTRARPWAVVVLGDTNSTLGCALAAAQSGFPVVHVEAGLRVTAGAMIEEINRRTVDAIAAVLCAPTEAAAAHLRNEQVRGRIEVTGDVARDVLVRFAHCAPPAARLPSWPLSADEPFIFATLHRAELTDDPDDLRAVLDALGRLDLTVVLAVHPRLRASLHRHRFLTRLSSSLLLIPPLGYLEALACIRDARVVVTDSGGIQREAYWLGTPCITMRAETEWTETVALGANVLVPPSSVGFLLAEAVRQWTDRASTETRWNRDVYGTGDAASRISDAVAELARSR